MLVAGRGRCGGGLQLTFEMDMAWCRVVGFLTTYVSMSAKVVTLLFGWIGEIPLSVRFRRLYELS